MGNVDGGQETSKMQPNIQPLRFPGSKSMRQYWPKLPKKENKLCPNEIGKGYVVLGSSQLTKQTNTAAPEKECSSSVYSLFLSQWFLQSLV